jgi:oligopeptide transport system substrate-binding protein
VLKNADVRRALSLVIDRKYIVDSITKAGQIPAGAFVPHGITDYDGKDFRENAGNYFSVDPVDYEKNIAEAKALLAKAGYPNGKGMPVLELKANPGHERIFEAVQQMWKENLGVDSTIGLEEWAVFQQTRLDKNYSLSRYSWIGDYDDPITFLGLFLSRSPQNVSSYSNAQYDKLLDVAMSTGNQKIRMDALHKAEKILIDDMAFIPFYFMTQPVILDPKLKGVQYSSLGKHKFFYAYLEE